LIFFSSKNEKNFYYQPIFVFGSLQELPDDIQNMMEQAVAVRKKKAPYSKFRVGAALLLDNGQTVLGSNQENAAYPSGLCAERVAIFQAGAIYPKNFKMAITAASDSIKQ
jgi:cytidine deaminase